MPSPVEGWGSKGPKDFQQFPDFTTVAIPVSQTVSKMANPQRVFPATFQSWPAALKHFNATPWPTPRWKDDQLRLNGQSFCFSKGKMSSGEIPQIHSHFRLQRWPSGPRRYVQVVVFTGAWVRTPPSAELFHS